jgi:hypothetical protein
MKKRIMKNRINGFAEPWMQHQLIAKRDEFAAAYLQREPPQPEKAVQDTPDGAQIKPRTDIALSHLVEAYALKKDVSGAEDSLKS